MFVPNFDDLHYVFLTSKVGMEKSTYDFLNILAYVGIIIITMIYNKFLTKVQVYVLILVSQLFAIIATSLMLFNATRTNIEVGINDEVLNGIIFLIGTQAVTILGGLPMQVVLTYLVPHNVEASTMALISGVLVWSYEVGAKISASIYCDIFEVDSEHMENYPHVLEAKLPVIVIMMLLTFIIPKNEDISKLAKFLRKEHV